MTDSIRFDQITCGYTTQTFYGCVIAVFSACQGISSPLYGL